jgi:hypothetical protein
MNYKPKLQYFNRPANFSLASEAVPPLTPETFNPWTDLEARDIVQATINAVQNRKKIERLQAQFDLDFNHITLSEGDN